MLEPGKGGVGGIGRGKRGTEEEGPGPGREGSGSKSCIELRGMWSELLCRRGQSAIVCNSKSYYQIGYGVYSSV